MSKQSRQRSRSERAAALLAEQRRKERRRRGLVVGGVVAVVLAVLAVAFVLGNRSDTSGEDARQPQGVDDFGVAVGEASAPTTITVYEDPQCPVCRDFESAVAEPLSAAVEAGDVLVDYRVVSFLDDASQNDYSSRAANALYAVQDVAGVDAFAEMHRLLYANQPAEGSAGPEDDQLVDWAVEAGASESEVRPLIEDGAFAQFVVNATDDMSKNGVTGTPTAFIDGERAGDSPQATIDAVLAAVSGD